MNRRRFTDEQTAAGLRQADVELGKGLKVPEVMVVCFISWDQAERGRCCGSVAVQNGAICSVATGRIVHLNPCI